MQIFGAMRDRFEAGGRLGKNANARRERTHMQEMSDDPQREELRKAISTRRPRSYYRTHDGHVEQERRGDEQRESRVLKV